MNVHHSKSYSEIRIRSASCNCMFSPARLPRRKERHRRLLASLDEPNPTLQGRERGEMEVSGNTLASCFKGCKAVFIICKDANCKDECPKGVFKKSGEKLDSCKTCLHANCGGYNQ